MIIIDICLQEKYLFTKYLVDLLATHILGRERLKCTSVSLPMSIFLPWWLRYINYSFRTFRITSPSNSNWFFITYNKIIMLFNWNTSGLSLKGSVCRGDFTVVIWTWHRIKLIKFNGKRLILSTNQYSFWVFKNYSQSS